jgi:Family of unknown function (DUF6353)
VSIKVKIAQAIGKTVLATKHHSPAILFVTGVAGVGASTVLACRATLKLESVLDETQKNIKKAELLHSQNLDNYSDMDYKQDSIVIRVRCVGSVAKLYAPAIVAGVIGIAALGGSHYILNKRNLALTAAYAGLDRSFKDYRKRVADTFGEDEEKRLHYEVQRDAMSEKNKDGSPSKTKRKDPTDHSVYARFFDEYSPNWTRTPELNLLFLKCQQDYANDKLRSQGHMLLNDVYEMLGIPRSSAGCVVGWRISKEGDNFIDFGIFSGKNLETRSFVNGQEPSILLDFNVDGVIYDKIED